MTREEAIQRLTDIHKFSGLLGLETADKQTLSMGIDALDVEPCEDAINRKAFDEALYEHFHDEDAPNNITEITLGSVRNFLKDFPSVAPTHKKGHWIKQENTKTTDLYRCSICGRSIILCKGAFLKDYPYCHCGAKMESEVEE